jgi:hypothetical protein
MTIEKVANKLSPKILPQKFAPFKKQDLCLDQLENKNNLKSDFVKSDEESHDDDFNVEQEITKILTKNKEEEPEEEEEYEEEEPEEEVEEEVEETEVEEEEAEVEEEEAVESEEEEVEEKKDKKTLYREERNELLWQLKKLEKSKVSIPVVDNFTSTEELKRILKDIRRESLFDSNISSLKTFLVTILHGVEWVGTQQLGLNLSGFAEHEQMYKMDEYDKCLIALSDRSYLGWSEGLPPEFALLIALATNTSLFILQNKGKTMRREMKGPSSII